MMSRRRPASSHTGEDSRAPDERRTKHRDDHLPELIIPPRLKLTRVQGTFTTFVPPRYVDFPSLADLFPNLQPLFDIQGWMVLLYAHTAYSPTAVTKFFNNLSLSDKGDFYTSIKGGATATAAGLSIPIVPAHSSSSKPGTMASLAAAPPTLDAAPPFLVLRRRQHLRSSVRSVAGLSRRPAPVSSFVTCPAAAQAAPVFFPHRGPRPSSSSRLLARASVPDDTGGGPRARPRSAIPPPEVEASTGSDLQSGEGYVGLFVRMLGLDNDPLDREQAVTTLYKYSQGGKHCVDAIMKFPGCVALVVNLLKSDSESVREAAAGLLWNISSVSLYMEPVARSGAIEEIAGLLCLSDLTPEVKERSLCTLWNLCTDEILRARIAQRDILPIMVKYLGDEEIKVVEAAGGVMENLALSQCNHSIMVECGVIPKLAELLKSNAEGHRVIRKEAKNALLELSKDDYYKILIIEEGLVLVPLVGADAYKSFRPAPHSWPSLPDGTEIERTTRPSRYGASELLLGLNIHEKSFSLEEAKMHAVIGRSQQQFLARIGAIEIEEKYSSSGSLAYNRQTILPWIHGVARLVLILGLEDASATLRAAYAIADASINEHMRVAFKEAGAVGLLVQLLEHNNEEVIEAGIHGLERLSVSSRVCQTIEAERLLDPLVNILKNRNASEKLKEKILSILARIFDPAKCVKDQFHENPVNGQLEMDIEISLQAMGRLPETQDLESTSEVIVRQKVLELGFISILVETLKMEMPYLQKMAASVLEYFAFFGEHVTAMTAAGIESGVTAIFQPSFLDGRDDDLKDERELNAIEVEESGLAIAAASRLLTKLLNFEIFSCSVDLKHFIHLLRKILKSDIPLNAKDWVAACLVKIESLVKAEVDIEFTINMEVTVYETIPRLVEQMRTSFSEELQEAAVVELSTIISKGMAECTKAVVSAGGIPLIVKLIEEGDGPAVEASLAILYDISMDIENHPAIVAAGAIPVLRRIVLSERPQWTLALNLLRTLPT
ncbi:hypothetical protein Taro_041750 [Colocasia esculenta]|uniref:Uncharacterized protein n=1 Tax=Colocasia esculenta TaxID=4460 RepID=A0A843WC94_COLES|nr:hypothetical protein [Colocasia esculenta]